MELLRAMMHADVRRQPAIPSSHDRSPRTLPASQPPRGARRTVAAGGELPDRGLRRLNEVGLKADVYVEGLLIRRFTARNPEPVMTVSVATPMIVCVLSGLQWRSLPEPLRVAADRLRVGSSRLPRKAAQFDAEAENDLAMIGAGTDARGPGAQPEALSRPVATSDSRRAG